jgi:hypothetical protein
MAGIGPADSPVPGQGQRLPGEETPEDLGQEPWCLDVERLAARARAEALCGLDDVRPVPRDTLTPAR